MANKYGVPDEEISCPCCGKLYTSKVQVCVNCEECETCCGCDENGDTTQFVDGEHFIEDFLGVEKLK
jgi:hypothetical protein